MPGKAEANQNLGSNEREEKASVGLVLSGVVSLQATGRSVAPVPMRPFHHGLSFSKTYASLSIVPSGWCPRRDVGPGGERYVPGTNATRD